MMMMMTRSSSRGIILMMMMTMLMMLVWRARITQVDVVKDQALVFTVEGLVTRVVMVVMERHGDTHAHKR